MTSQPAILFVARSLGVGGAERQLVVLAKALAAAGHGVEVALFYPGGPLDRELTDAGIPIHSLQKQGRWDLFGPVQRLRALVRSGRFGVVHGYLPVANIAAALACRLVRKPLKLVFGIRASNMNMALYDRVSHWTYVIEARLARRADLIIANAEKGANEACKRGMPADRITVISNGIDTAQFTMDPNAASRVGPYRIGMAARLDPMKDHRTFLAAARFVAAQRSDASFVLVGSGVETLANAAAGLPIELHGATLNPEALLATFDVAVLSSSAGEGFPNAVAEAMACGVPCAVTDVGDSARIVGDLGAVAPPSDPRALADAILSLLPIARDPVRRAACRARIETEFSVARLRDRTAAALGELRKPLVLHIVTDLDGGGAEGMLARLVQVAGPFRHKVVSLTDEGIWGKPLRDAGIGVVALNLRRGAVTPSALWRLMRLIRRMKPAVVQTWLYHADLVGLVAAKMSTRAPVVWNLRCSDMELAQYSRLTALVLRVLTWLSPLPAAVIVNSAAGQHRHTQIGYRPRDWRYLPNGIDVVKFKPDVEARRRWRERLNLGDDTVLVGMAARRDPMKDHEGLLRAAAQIKGDVAIALVGSGVDQKDATLAQLAKDSGKPVHLLGHTGDMPGFMAALDVAVLASLGEGFPNVVAEAMACGVPVIGTDVGDVATIVADTGVVVPKRDEKALADAIAALAADRGLRASLGTRARARVVDNYALPEVAARYNAMWAQIGKVETSAA